MLYQHRTAVLLIVIAAGLALLAQQNPEFTAWMKASDAAVQALDKLENKTGPEAVRSAERLGAVYENMIGYWRQRSAPDAVKWSKEGKAAAVQLSAAAHAGNAARASAAFSSITANCRSCHEAYRVKLPDGRFASKPESAERQRPPRERKQ